MSPAPVSREGVAGYEKVSTPFPSKDWRIEHRFRMLKRLISKVIVLIFKISIFL